jgi:thiol:disulfide interchange protein
LPDAAAFLLLVKRWWLVWTITVAVGSFITGCLATGFVKFTIYYLAEEQSMAKLASQGSMLLTVVGDIASIEAHLAHIEATISEQHFSDQSVASKLTDLADHVHALDARADGDRVLLTDFLSQQKRNSEQILFLLDPKGARK